MSYSGQAAIDFLASQVRSVDPGESSHWRLFHRDFSVGADGRFSGLDGFGGCTPPYRGLRALVHRVLQQKFRRLGRIYHGFDRLDRISCSITDAQERACDLDVLRQAITLAFLRHRLPEFAEGAVVGVVGDGFASMTALLLASGFARQVVLVNLNKTLLVDLTYFQKWARNTQPVRDHVLVTDAAGIAECVEQQDASVVAIQASNHALLQHAPMDLVINIVSMQEMDPPVIAAYFDDLRAVAATRRLYFYCCNREEKRLPDGAVTRFADYPWSPRDDVLVDELCPWHQQYYATRRPFYRRYDGPIRHRLVGMAAH